MISPGELFPVERRDRILGLLRQEGKVVALDVARRLNVSIDTIRRDLEYLASTGSIRRVHGGALPAAPVPGRIQQRSSEETEAKEELGKRGALLIRPGSVVVFDSGSSNLGIVKALPRDLQFTAVTPCLPIASALGEFSEVEVVVLGGRLHRRESMTVGLRAAKELEDFRADLCFLGVCALHADVGISTLSVEELEMKQAIVRCAGEIVGLITASKFNKAAPFVVGSVGILTRAIVERGVAASELELLRRYGVLVD
ncbi:MAG TPA: DeoR/GlpR family DNA-binding transcription regulator [Chthoniobacterales bacterium]|nr:DeoR/GlpR family DNA-binding transcription regulator [Chthoniobacterales bacterium]